MNDFSFISRQMRSLSVKFLPKPGMSAILPSSTSAAVSMPQERRTAQRQGQGCVIHEVRRVVGYQSQLDEHSAGGSVPYQIFGPLRYSFSEDYIGSALALNF